MKTSHIVLSTILAISFSACSATIKKEGIVPLDKNELAIQKQEIKGLVSSLSASSYFENIDPSNTQKSFHPEMDYLEVLLSYNIPEDPSSMLLLLNYYVAANQQVRGIDFFERILEKYQYQMSDITRSNVLAVYAVLRATYANDVALAIRIPWVLDTFKLLEEAKNLSNDENPIVHWSAGLIYAQMPFFFFKHDQAIKELTWLADRPETEPMPGFYREVYHYLSKLYEKDGEKEKAQIFLVKSGYQDYEPKSLFMDWMTSTNKDGVSFAPEPWMEEIVKDRVYSMHGFGFSDIHFIISEDETKLIAIDAGTQPFNSKKAYEYLKERRSNLPLISHLILTHAHWDHVGGYTGFLELNPDLHIIGSAQFRSVLQRATRVPKYKQFRSDSYTNSWLEGFGYHLEINGKKTLSIGGTRFDLEVVIGNETEDALFISLPKQKVLFVGDVLMPYLGDPWVEEGFIDEPILAMKTINEYKAEHILHGHYGLTFMYGTNEQIKEFSKVYKWLTQSVYTHIKAGYSVNEIMRLNLIPPGLEKHPELFIGYLAQRKYVIARMVDKMTGYWHENKTNEEPRGFFSLTSVEYGRLLQMYMNLSESNIVSSLEDMLKNGDLELALKMSIAALVVYPDSDELLEKKEEAADRLRSVSQFFDPMKFAVYTEMIGQEHKRMKTKQ